MPTRNKPSVTHRAFVMRSLLLALCLLGLISVASAQQPNAQVLFSGNMPNQPDGPVVVRLRLYNANAAGTLLFEEAQTVNVTSQTFKQAQITALKALVCELRPGAQTSVVDPSL